MDTQHNVNKRVQEQLESQVTELGTATELTLGHGGSSFEGRSAWQSRHRMTEASKQITELGAATELTLGRGDSHAEGPRGWFYTTL